MLANSDIICILAKKYVKLNPNCAVRCATAVRFCSFVLVLNMVQLLAVACYS